MPTAPGGGVPGLRSSLRWSLPIALAAMLTGCGPGATAPTDEALFRDFGADQVAIGSKTEMTSGGIRTATVHGDSVYFFEGGQRTHLMGVTATFFAENGAPTGTLTAATADYDLGSRHFVARGDVVLITRGPDGPRRLETDELHHDLQTREIWSDQPFTLVENGRTSRGTSFRTDPDFRRWQVTGSETSGTAPPGFGF